METNGNKQIWAFTSAAHAHVLKLEQYGEDDGVFSVRMAQTVFWGKVEKELGERRKGRSRRERETRWSKGEVNVVKYIIDVNENVTTKLIIMWT